MPSVHSSPTAEAGRAWELKLLQCRHAWCRPWTAQRRHCVHTWTAQRRHCVHTAHPVQLHRPAAQLQRCIPQLTQIGKMACIAQSSAVRQGAECSMQMRSCCCPSPSGMHLIYVLICEQLQLRFHIHHWAFLICSSLV